MAGNVIQNLIGNRDAIRKIMARDASGEMDSIAENARKSGILTYSEEGAMYTPKDNQSNNTDITINEEVMNGHPYMPKQVLESFRKNPGKTASTSVLGNIPDGTLPKIKKEAIRESAASNSNIPQTSSNIDYSLLKTIINEAVQENVKKYVSALGKKMINENVGGDSNNLMCMKLGSKFSFIDSKGNIYEATLKHVKKIDI